MKKRFQAIPYRTQRQIYGVLFLLPWIIGFVLFFLTPMVQSFIYSFSEISPSTTKMTVEWVGFKNYSKVFFEHPTFNRKLTESIVDTLINVPIILIFSLFAATLLNGEYKGRGLARAIFFVPVIISSGAISTALGGGGNFMRDLMDASGSNAGLLQSFQLNTLLVQSGLPKVFVLFLTEVVNRIYEIISYSGVQILIFLAGLQAIEPALYEASKIEGATAYEIFWKITLPMVSPLILTNMVFTVVDAFIRSQVTGMIHSTAFRASNFGMSAAMSWLYFTSIAIILAISMYFVSKGVFYDE